MTYSLGENQVAAGASIDGKECNPTETIEAHAWYAADYIAQNFNDLAI